MQQSGLGALPDQRRITRVHEIRNDAQHRAKFPDPSEVSDCRTYVRDFLQQVTVHVWNLPFEQISLTDLIQHPEVKKYLVDAETALASKDYNEAAGQAAAAISWTLYRAGLEIVGRGEHSKFWGEIAVTQQKRPNERLGQEMYRSFWKMQDTLRILSLGLNYADYAHYQETLLELSMGVIVSEMTGKPKIFNNPQVCTLKSTAEYLVSYAMDTVLQ